jgi:hypothetical protein
MHDILRTSMTTGEKGFRNKTIYKQKRKVTNWKEAENEKRVNDLQKDQGPRESSLCGGVLPCFLFFARCLFP